MAKEKKPTNRSETTALEESDLDYLRTLQDERDSANEAYEEAVRALEESDLWKAKQETEHEFTRDDSAYKDAERSVRHRYRMHPKDKIDLETGEITRVDPEAYQAGQVDAVTRVRELQARQAARRAGQ